MRRGALSVMAEEMRSTVLAHQPPMAVWRPLQRGLILVLERTADQEWRLALGRKDVYPSEQEIAICQGAFTVPVGTQVAKRTRQRLNSQRELVTFYVVEMFWREVDETRLENCGMGVGALPAEHADGHP